MWLVSTIFDDVVKSPRAPRPVVSLLFNTKTKEYHKFDLFREKNSLFGIVKRLKFLKALIQSGEAISINDVKSHIDAMAGHGLVVGFDEPYKVFSRVEKIPYDRTATVDQLFATCKASIVNVVKSGDLRPLWQKLNGRASLIYALLQTRGFWDGIKFNYPLYSMNSSSGRPNAAGYTIFNQAPDAPIFPIDRTHTKFIQFDWIAADFRAASLLSGDPKMLESFKVSDPYNTLADALQHDRKECKKGLLVATNALNPTSPMVQYYDKFSAWMVESIDSLHTNGFLTSLLGRKFSYVGDVSDPEVRYTQDKRIFNAILQGTVVHAMQNVLWLVYHHFGNHFLTDRFDGIVMTADESSLDFIIKHVGDIMFRPFQNVLESGTPEFLKDATFPVAISVGDRWGDYKHVKDIR